MKKFFAVVALAALPGLALAQRDYSKVEVKAEKLSDTTYMLTGAGGNLGLSVGDDAVFLVDDQYAPLTPKILAAIKAITPKPVKFVVNTHWHDDHSGGNENLGKAGVTIFAHHNVRKRMNSEQFIAFFNLKSAPSPKDALPVITFSTDMSFHINGDEVKVMHVPKAHTDGDSIVYFSKANVMHMGDTFFNGLYPFIDTSSGGNAEGLVAAVDHVLIMINDATKVIPGHGPLATKADLKAYRDMVANVTAKVKKLIGEGKTSEQVVAAKPSAEYDEKWGKGFIKPDKFAEMLYANLKP
ncbi:MBL fold metallo-hydrolase [Usitatibacter palustris]|uniref:Metallo-beta-lactamase domain-containing protein n=1 Tax=Usitatibacter palustris TaxID=2732487 RepID=A0A6M4H2H9_9PROT|nr:MBL fold metallo-hydrolase [Usitatibacter palustris]QJR13751.1 hypothetical protein DSM104440_00541 [Usitatibacter palustris]